MMIDLSPGEVADRISILRAKMDGPLEEEKWLSVRMEHWMLSESFRITTALSEDLYIANRNSFDNIEAISECLAANDTTSERFQQAVRGAFEANARRAAIKRRINEEAGWTGPQEQKTAAVMALAK
jgi:hypothetical protein